MFLNVIVSHGRDANESLSRVFFGRNTIKQSSFRFQSEPSRQIGESGFRRAERRHVAGKRVRRNGILEKASGNGIRVGDTQRYAGRRARSGGGRGSVSMVIVVVTMMLVMMIMTMLMMSVNTRIG